MANPQEYLSPNQKPSFIGHETILEKLCDESTYEFT
jgi:hypothetical protein